MSSFVEFQAMVLGKLCSIEERISNIENVLGINSEDSAEEDVVLTVENSEKISRENTFGDELSDFHRQLEDIKSVFNASDI